MSELIKRVGRNILWCREYLGWTQKDLSIRIGMTRSSVVKYELGAHAPPLEILERIARVFKKKPEWFLREHGHFKNAD